MHVIQFSGCIYFLPATQSDLRYLSCSGVCIGKTYNDFIGNIIFCSKLGKTSCHIAVFGCCFLRYSAPSLIPSIKIASLTLDLVGLRAPLGDYVFSSNSRKALVGFRGLHDPHSWIVKRLTHYTYGKNTNIMHYGSEQQSIFMVDHGHGLLQAYTKFRLFIFYMTIK